MSDKVLTITKKDKSWLLFNISEPINFLPFLFDAIAVDPVPRNGSKTKFPQLVNVSIAVFVEQSGRRLDGRIP